jgi:hypothetical protein
MKIVRGTRICLDEQHFEPILAYSLHDTHACSTFACMHAMGWGIEPGASIPARALPHRPHPSTPQPLKLKAKGGRDRLARGINPPFFRSLNQVGAQQERNLFSSEFQSLMESRATIHHGLTNCRPSSPLGPRSLVRVSGGGLLLQSKPCAL